MKAAGTNTWYGRGTPPSATEIVKNIAAAWKALGSVPVYGIIDEDFFFIRVADHDVVAVAEEDENEYDEEVIDGVIVSFWTVNMDDCDNMFPEEANTLNDAIRIWWNYYGKFDPEPDEVEEIYNRSEGEWDEPEYSEYDPAATEM